MKKRLQMREIKTIKVYANGIQYLPGASLSSEIECLQGEVGHHLI